MNMKAPLISDLKVRRQALGWSVKDLGERCGIEEKLLSDWEHGLASPRLDAVESWASALGVRLGLAAAQADARRGIRIDWTTRCLTLDGAPVRLTPMEWKALERLAKVPGELVTHQDLFRHLYGEDQPYRAQSTAIRVLITKLRRLLPPLRIEARWGRGYVVSGIEPPTPGTPAGSEAEAEVAKPFVRMAPVEPLPGKAQRETVALFPDLAPRDAAPPRRERPELSYAAISAVRHATTAPVRVSACRADEVGAIERFLAERGVTRCPDVATIQHSPLPTLVWDKMKRKWVRPPQPMAGREAS
jgi:transcriptional regulator with XRE-family HTH domain